MNYPVIVSFAAILLFSCAVKTSDRYILLKECASETEQEFTVTHGKGTLVAAGRYSNGKLDGELTCCASTGETLAVMIYRDGVKEGMTTLWYPPMSTGGRKQVKVQCSFMNDTLNGDKTSWFSNGSRKAVYRYRMGEIISAKVFRRDGSENTDVDALSQAKRDEFSDDGFYRSMLNVVNAPDSIGCR